MTPPFRIPAGATPNQIASQGPGAASTTDWALARGAVLEANRATLVEAERRARIAERDHPSVVAAYEERCAELDAAAVPWVSLGAMTLGAVGCVYGVRHGIAEDRHARERYERERDRAAERHERAVERWERERDERYDREHRAAVAMVERWETADDDRSRTDLARLRYAPALSRWDAPEAPRLPREPEPPDSMMTIAAWLVAGGAGGALLGVGGGALVEHVVGPRRGPWEAEMPHVVEDRLRVRLEWFGDGVPPWRIEGWRAIWRELARAERGGNRAGARLVGAVAREIPGGRVVAAFLNEQDGEKQR